MTDAAGIVIVQVQIRLESSERAGDELVILACHDLQQRALARAVQPEHTNLRAGKKRQPDVLENDGVGRMNLPEPFHRVDVLHVPICDS